MMKNKILYILGLLLLSVSCNDYLDQIPDNRATLDNAESIKELLVTAYPGGSYIPFCEVMSDNARDKGNASSSSRKIFEQYNWNNNKETDQDTPTYYWNNCYEAIAAANQALASLEEITIDPEKKKELRGEALLCRAYAHYMLASLFCKPYDPAILETELGVPYVTEPETVVIKEYKRLSLKETFDNIRKDLEEGLSLVQNSYDVPQYHFTIESSAAFASRFYLTIGEWENVVKYADIALGTTANEKIRDWSKGSYYQISGYYEIKDRYSSVDEKANLLLASVMTSWPRTWLSRYSMTAEMADEIFQNVKNNCLNLRLAYRVFGNELYKNVPKVKEYFKKGSINSNSGWIYQMITLFSGDEVLLNRAEAYAMLNQKDKAAEDIALFYSKKSNTSYDTILDLILKGNKIEKYYEMDDVLYNPFYTIPAESLAYIKCITDAKRVEFMHEGLRWFDIRRFKLPVVHTIVSDSQNNQSIELTADDNRKVLQIPDDAIAYGVEPNKRD